MRLTTIGTGTAAPHPLRVQSGSLLEAGDVRLLVDCGSGVLSRMAQLGLDWQSLTHVALTHFHPDHASDLANLLVAWRYGQLPPREAPVTLIGPPGFSAFLDRVSAAFFAGLRELVPGTQVVELVPGVPFALAPSTTITSCKVPHTAESVAFAIAHAGMRVVCSGDLGPDPAFATWAAGADLLLLECSLPRELGVPIHLTPEDCAEVARVAQPGQLVLNHFYPPVEAVDIGAIIASAYAGPVSLAHDGAVFTVDARDRNAPAPTGYRQP